MYPADKCVSVECCAVLLVVPRQTDGSSEAILTNNADARKKGGS